MPQAANAQRREQIMLPMEYRDATVGAVRDDARTIDVTWTTGATVRRRDFWTGEEWDEVLVVNAEAVDLTRLNNGGPVLAAPQRWGLDGIIGVVERAWLENGQGAATLRFPAKGLRAASDEIFGLIRDGIVRQVSVGYATLKAEWDRSVVPPQRKATRWQ